MLLSADWHLTDSPADEYRWAVFDHIAMLGHRLRDFDFFMLGDLTDRKDRHSAALVNRVIESFRKLKGFHIWVLMGNHDMPLNGPPFWQFLSDLNLDVQFITQPVAIDQRILALPYAHDPATEWKAIPFENYKCIFMHQTVTGVKSGGHTLENNKMPLFPRGPKIYSGDIHTPQVVNRVTYVGAPHPVKFGDNYQCRILQIDKDFKICHEEILTPPDKLILDINDIHQLDEFEVRSGDQVRIRVSWPVNRIDDWPAEQERIMAWAQRNDVNVASVEAVVEATASAEKVEGQPDTFDSDPLDVFEMFGAAEGIDESLLEAGRALLQEHLKGV